ncbi:hypothetical protein SAMN05421823_103437 [Catalinimonas alkaloidigena]|uniref:Uncharacterized protein n=1 Tax=Catalinimonas alkaloidigena TaxID=1075417 RepID=A0A1G9EDY6_9BACT|nr:hypothetical protein [Catalinimonas alkaloidigena]SDK74293.1 hypothetical protein SAMN05421823_103437 [Catalinimonas alkaloidigena]
MTVGGAAMIFAGLVMLRGGGNLFGTGITGWGGLIPFFIGLIFFSSGIRLLRGTQ